jgi:hypothetical protein
MLKLLRCSIITKGPTLSGIPRNLFASLDAVIGQAEQREANAYLSQSHNLADLEIRQRQLQQRGACKHPFFSW